MENENVQVPKWLLKMILETATYGIDKIAPISPMIKLENEAGLATLLGKMDWLKAEMKTLLR